MSYKVEVLTRGESIWTSNALRFTTFDEADASGGELASRWFAITSWRVAESDDAVNYTFIDGRNVRLDVHDCASGGTEVGNEACPV